MLVWGKMLLYWVHNTVGLNYHYPNVPVLCIQPKLASVDPVYLKNKEAVGTCDGALHRPVTLTLIPTLMNIPSHPKEARCGGSVDARRKRASLGWGRARTEYIINLQFVTTYWLCTQWDSCAKNQGSHFCSHLHYRFRISRIVCIQCLEGTHTQI